MTETHELTRGTTPLLVSFPHVGTEIPDDIAQRLTPVALQRADTDWHLPLLYNFARELGASTLVAHFSRFVIDLNRPPGDASLYPGRDTTGLVPIDTFHKESLYQGALPAAAEIAARRERYWRPYHVALATEIERLQSEHGVAVLWDAHSIASVLPRFFDGKLPDLNLGTADGASCSPQLQSVVESTLRSQSAYTWVANGRFTGGYITRRYGQPTKAVHALQMEMCQCTYMDESAPFALREDLADGVRPILRALLDTVLRWAKSTGARHA